jgi:hypothetical protein
MGRGNIAIVCCTRISRSSIRRHWLQIRYPVPVSSDRTSDCFTLFGQILLPGVKPAEKATGVDFIVLPESASL